MQIMLITPVVFVISGDPLEISALGKIKSIRLYLHFVSRHTLQQEFTVTLLLYLVTIASSLALLQSVWPHLLPLE